MTERQDILKSIYAAATRILEGVGTEEDYRLECKFYTVLTSALSQQDWDRLGNLIGG